MWYLHLRNPRRFPEFSRPYEFRETFEEIRIRAKFYYRNYGVLSFLTTNVFSVAVSDVEIRHFYGRK